MTEKPKILYIEDNFDNQRLVQRVLGARGYEVMLAADGMAGVALARESLPGLILVDVNIPGLDGYETAARLRSMPHLRESPVVALTADVSPGARERALAAGCDGYLSKPIDPHQLPRQIAEFIAGRREFVPPPVETRVLREHHQRVVERLEQRVKDLTEANAALQEADRLKNQFLTSLSHELRTPLTSVIGYLDLLRRGTLGELNTRQSEALDVVQRNFMLLNRHVNNLLYLQEYRSNQLALTVFAPLHMVSHVLAEMKARAQHHGVEFVTDVDELAPLHGDPVALELVLENLLDNAIKFTPVGGTVTLTLRDEPSRLIIRVEDNGVGIPEEALEKIFLPFYRVDASLADTECGNGVGLALVQHVVRGHGGQVTVRSTPDHGSVFTVTIPKHQATNLDETLTPRSE